MSENEEEASAQPGGRVEDGEFFVEQTEPDGCWVFGRGREVLLTGLSREEALSLLSRHAKGLQP
jgi:hypothetical protein